MGYDTIEINLVWYVILILIENWYLTLTFMYFETWLLTFLLYFGKFPKWNLDIFCDPASWNF